MGEVGDAAERRPTDVHTGPGGHCCDTHDCSLEVKATQEASFSTEVEGLRTVIMDLMTAAMNGATNDCKHAHSH